MSCVGLSGHSRGSLLPSVLQRVIGATLCFLGRAAGSGPRCRGPPDKTEHFLNATLSSSGVGGRDRDKCGLTEYPEGRSLAENKWVIVSIGDEAEDKRGEMSDRAAIRSKIRVCYGQVQVRGCLRCMIMHDKRGKRKSA